MNYLVETVVSSVSGGAYGLTAVVLSQPFDTIKTRQQALAAHMRGSALDTMRATVRHEGWSALFKGVVPAATGSILFRTLPFVAVNNFSVFAKDSVFLQDRPVREYLPLSPPCLPSTFF